MPTAYVMVRRNYLLSKVFYPKLTRTLQMGWIVCLAVMEIGALVYFV